MSWKENKAVGLVAAGLIVVTAAQLGMTCVRQRKAEAAEKASRERVLQQPQWLPNQPPSSR